MLKNLTQAYFETVVKKNCQSKKSCKTESANFSVLCAPMMILPVISRPIIHDLAKGYLANFRLLSVSPVIRMPVSSDNASLFFAVGSTFDSYEEFSEKVELFEESTFVNLYKRSTRSISSSRIRAPLKKFQERLKYTEIDMACIYGGKRFKSLSKGVRPIKTS